MHELTVLIKDDMKPALGVTEPGAIAFAVSKAGSYLTGEIQKVKVALNSGMYKNAFTCGIPGSDAFGNVFAAALGAVAGNAEYGLEALKDVDDEANQRAQKLIDEKKVEVTLDHMGSAITIDAAVSDGKEECLVRVAGGHTDIYYIEKNGTVLYEKEESTKEEQEEGPVIHRYTFAQILSYINAVPEEELAFIKEAFCMNMDLLEEGLASQRTTFGPQLLKENGGVLFSGRPLATAQLLCNGAIEARVLGLSKPAMSITGSGAHGIIATLPLYAYYNAAAEELSEAVLLRAAALSYLITMYIKEYSGKLSAFCGCGIAAGTGMACGLCYMRGGGYDELCAVIQNMASGLTGMICDGGNQGCVMKGIVATDAAFRSVDLALKSVQIDKIHGINGLSPEDTMRNMGRIASPGMVETERTIVEIMQNKHDGKR